MQSRVTWRAAYFWDKKNLEGNQGNEKRTKWTEGQDYRWRRRM